EGEEVSVNAFRRAARVVADEGFAGLIRRLSGKLLHGARRPQPTAESETAVTPPAPPPYEAPPPAPVVPPAAPLPLEAAAEVLSPTQIALRALAEPGRLAEARAQYEQQAEEFRRRTHRRGWKGLEHYYWYHTVDLGGGLVTPGDHDFRDSLPAFGFPRARPASAAPTSAPPPGSFPFESRAPGPETSPRRAPHPET